MAEDKKVTQMTPYTRMESTDLLPFIRTSEVDQDLQNGYILYADLKNELLYPTVNVFADLYLELDVLESGRWTRFGVVFLLSLLVFILIAKNKTLGVKDDI